MKRFLSAAVLTGLVFLVTLTSAVQGQQAPSTAEFKKAGIWSRDIQRHRDGVKITIQTKRQQDIRSLSASLAPVLTTTVTAYCLKSSTTSGPSTVKIRELTGKPCIALSRKLAKDLGLKCGPGQYDYRFGCIIEIVGVGKFAFHDLMPPKWRGYRVDIWMSTAKECHVFGVKRCQVRVVSLARRNERDAKSPILDLLRRP